MRITSRILSNRRCAIGTIYLVADTPIVRRVALHACIHT